MHARAIENNQLMDCVAQLDRDTNCQWKISGQECLGPTQDAAVM